MKKIEKFPKIIIVGAGPIGCYLGQMLKHYGFNPSLFEEHKEVGLPVSCAGIVGKDVFSATVIPISKQSILNVIDGAKINFNDSAFLLNRPSVAYIVDRAAFDKNLSLGLDIQFETRLEDIKKEENGYLLKTTKGEYFAEILIGADGPYSRVRKLLGFNSNLTLYKGLQYRIKKEVPDKDRVQVNYIKPFSFFNWLIPEGNGIVRIGTISNKPIFELEKFMEENGIKGEIIEKNAGPVPIGTCDLVKENAALVGDAACQVKPITAGGIFYGIKSAEILAKAIKNENLKNYEQEWEESCGKEISLCLLIRYVMENIDNKVLKKVFEYIKENAPLIEKMGDFENHSSVLWSLVANPRTYPTIGSVFMGVMKNPKILMRLLRRR